jgi:hypothetical protein
MKYPFRRHLVAGVGAIVIGVVLIPLLLLIFTVSFVASIPSRVGEYTPVEGVLFRLMDWTLDFELMRQFRDDIHHRIRPHIEFADEFDRWWIIREMELTVDRTDRELQSGEYTLVVVLAIGSVFIDASVWGIPMSAVLTFLAVGLSGLIIVRLTTIRVLAFRPGAYLEDSTHDLAVRMAFNKGPLSRGSSVGIAMLALLIGVTGGRGYEIGLEIVEAFASLSHPEDDARWRVNK